MIKIELTAKHGSDLRHALHRGDSCATLEVQW